MLLPTLEQKQSFKTPEKKFSRSPEAETIPKAPHVPKTEPNLKQMSELMTSLGMDDSCDTVERELVQNDNLWMKEMMTV
jgi:hypothetical protein